MKHILILEAVIRPPNDMLLQIVVGLREVTTSPESFVWTAIPDSREARLWAVLDVERAQLEKLAAFYRDIPGVTSVRISEKDQPPGIYEPASRIAGSPLHHPFTD